MVTAVDAAVFEFAAYDQVVEFTGQSEVHDGTPVVTVGFDIESLVIRVFHPFVEFEIVLALKVKSCVVGKFTFFTVEAALYPVVVEVTVFPVRSLDFFTFSPFVFVKVIGQIDVEECGRTV